MKKKRPIGWKIGLWVLVVGALLAFIFIPDTGKAPRSAWRVPVKVSVPSLKEIEKALPDLPKVSEEVKELAQVPQQVLDAFTGMPLYPYEEETPSGEKKEGVEEPASTQAPRPAVGVPSFVPKGFVSRIAIIIDDMGLAPTLSERAVRLPAEITLAYLPYAQGLPEQTAKAKAAGHDLLLHMPMEPLGRENPGPWALRTDDDEEVLKYKIAKNVKAFDGYVGVNNHMGSKATIDRRVLEVFFKELRERDVFFIDSRTNVKSIAESVAREVGLKAAVRDVFLDDTQTEGAVRSELERAEKIARQKGYVIVIGHPHAVTLAVLEQWTQGLKARNFELVPVRMLVR